MYKKKVAVEMDQEEGGKCKSRQVSHDESLSSGDESNGDQQKDIKAETAETTDNPTTTPHKPKPPPKRRRRRSKDAAPMSFPQKLMEILTSGTHTDIISWLPHGRGFMIYQKKRFAAEVMPKYFKQSKFTSFTRKLNRWNFTRITRGPETGAYYHELFRRGEFRLCMQMCCQATKNQELQQEQSAANQALAANPTVSDPRWGLSAGLSRIEDVVRSPAGEPKTAPGATSSATVGANEKTAAQAAPRHTAGLAELLTAAAGVRGTAAVASSDLVRQYQLDQQQSQQRLILRQAEQAKQQEDHIAAILRSQQQTALLSQLAGGGIARGALDVTSTLQRNPNTYLAMLMAQEKARAQLTGSAATPGATILPAVDNLQFQASLLQAQQQQRLLQQQLTHQRLLQAVAMRQKDQGQTSMRTDTASLAQQTMGASSEATNLNSLLEGSNDNTERIEASSDPPANASSSRNPAA